MFYRSCRADVFCKNGVLTNFEKFAGKYLCQACNFIKIETLAHVFRSFPVNFGKFLRTPFLRGHLWWPLLVLTNF